MPEDYITKLNRMGRRQFTKTLSGLGISIGAINALSTEAIGDITTDPRKEVPYVARYVRDRSDKSSPVLHDSEPPEWETELDTISRGKWYQIEASHKAAKKD